jgi:all-trans-retinol 13,14-reductase
MKRIGRRYRKGRTQDSYDVIVIGSGIGGLCNAALLSKLGRKVCVLEQHYTAGGFTHSYEREGYEWDVGVHYVGEVHKPHSQLRRVFDVISDGKLQWAQMDEVYDRIIIGDQSYDFVRGVENFKNAIKQHFPEESEAIDRYVDLVYKVARSSQTFFKGQAMSPLLARAYNRLRPLLVPKEFLQTTRQVLESLTQNQQLIGVLTGQWGDYGMVPAEATFFMHAAVVKHYFDGGNYPVGGSWKIAETIVPVIKAAGGDVFTYARVKEILIEDGRACGVVMDTGDVIRARAVVSNAGARNTFEKLLPAAQRAQFGYEQKLKKVKPSSSHLCLYVGLKGSAAELKIPRTNLWVYPSPHHERNIEAYLQDPQREFPMLYISFPSAKDPSWDEHYPGKATVEVLTLGPYEWYEKWADQTWNQRGADYEAIKEQTCKRLLAELFKHMPQLEAALDYYELSTPLSTQWFQLNDRGEIYGLDHDPDRFRQDWLHPVTPIKNLYMTGQDVVTAGVGGALMAGVLTTAAMMGARYNQVFKLLKSWTPPETRPQGSPLLVE